MYTSVRYSTYNRLWFRKINAFVPKNSIFLRSSNVYEALRSYYFFFYCLFIIPELKTAEEHATIYSVQYIAYDDQQIYSCNELSGYL